MIRPSRLLLILMVAFSISFSGCEPQATDTPAADHNMAPGVVDSHNDSDGHVESAAAGSTDSTATATEQDANQPATGPADSLPLSRLHRIHFKSGNGDRVYEIKPEHDGAKLVDPDEKEIARFNLDERKLKVKRPDDSVVGYIKALSSEFRIVDASQETELFELQRQPDGDWKLKNGADELLALIKVRDYGFEIEDGRETSLMKIKNKEGKLSVRNAADETILYTKDACELLAVTCMGLDAIESLELRAGLLVSVQMFLDAAH